VLMYAMLPGRGVMRSPGFREAICRDESVVSGATERP